MGKTVNIGMFGLGTVGTGVVRYLNESYEGWKNGLDIHIKQFCVRDITKQRYHDLQGIITDNPDAIIGDSNIHVVVEVMGGVSPAGAYIEAALQGGKHVVTANKALLTSEQEQCLSEYKKNAHGMLSHHYMPKFWGKNKEFQYALRCCRNIGFEASVCGEIPIIDVVSALPGGKDVVCLEGILNGTSNYLLTKMSEGIEYQDALSKAQEKGFAESDPAFDVNGIDASQKLSILSTLIFGYKVVPSQIPSEPITSIRREDIILAGNLGYVIKPLSLARYHDEGVLELRNGPCLVLKKDMLAAVQNETNATSLYFHDRDEPLTLIGKGAGMMPTARSVVKDIISVVHNRIEARKHIYDFFLQKQSHFDECKDDFEYPSYLKLNVEQDSSTHTNPGHILDDIVRPAFGRNSLSVRDTCIIQGNGQHHFAILLNKAPEKKIKKALGEIAQEGIKDMLSLRVKE